MHAVLVARVPADEAEDLAQECFLEAWRALPDLREPAKFGAWLVAIARRRAARRHARAKTPPRPLPDGEADEPADPSAPAPGAALLADELLAQLRALPAHYREALSLRLVDGRTGPEIAALLGRSHGAVRVHLARGMRLLRERLAAVGWSEEARS